MLAEHSQTLKVLRGACQLPWECGVLRCQLTIQKFMTWENCGSFISKISLSASRFGLSHLVPMHPGRCTWGQRRAHSPSFQTGGTVRNPVCSLPMPDRKLPIAIICSHCHSRQYVENKVEFFISLKIEDLWILSP